MQKGFEYLEHLSDAGISFYGNTLKELFENAALGMFSLISDTGLIRPAKKLEIRVTSGGEKVDDLLVLWLEDLLYHFEVDRMLFCRFSITRLDRQAGCYRLSALALGEEVDRARHEIRLGIKAPTYHQLEVHHEKDGWRGKVIFDI